MSQTFRKNIPPQLYVKHLQHFDYKSSTINFKTSFGNCVYKALCNRKWKEVDKQSIDWNLQWSQKERINDIFVNGVKQNQRVNHFRLYTQLCRKDMLMKNIKKHKRQLAKEKKLVEKDWSFLPLTFFLPSQYIMFSEQFKRQGGIWIMKPTARCQGSGIFLVDKLAQVAPYRFKKPLGTQTQQPNNRLSNQPKIIDTKHKPIKPVLKVQQSSQQQGEQEIQQQVKGSQQKQNQTWIIQQYISNPLLFGRKKFDLRIYVLCTNYSQLTVWLYRSGFARFTHQPYNTQNILDLGSHLTNVQIQKHTDNYDQIRGGKWLIDRFKHYLIAKYGIQRTDQCFYQMQQIIVHSLQAVQKHIIVSKNSFQLYGYDLMIDSNLKPWLIQVNGGPSMTANTDFDCKLKCGLIDDVLTIVNFQGIITGQQMTIGGFDLIVNKGVNVVKSIYSDTHTNLGWKNNRAHNYKHLLREFYIRKSAQSQPYRLKQKSIQQKQNAKSQQPLKKQKLLPNFYYKQKPLQQIDESIRKFLKKELKHLNQKNENLVSMEFQQNQKEFQNQDQIYHAYKRKYDLNYHRFVPLKVNK